MNGKSDQAKGRVKKAVAALTGNKKLERQGRTQETKGKVKVKVDRGAKKVNKALGR